MSASRSPTKPIRRAGTAAALFAIASLLALLAASSVEAAPPAPAFYGVVPQEAPTATDFAQMRSDRVGMVRELFNWPRVESQPGVYDWSYYDEVMRRATTHGIEVWPVLFGTAGWAHEAGSDCGSACAPRSAAARAGFARFAAAAAQRYGPGGDFWTDEPVTDDPVVVPPCKLPIVCPLLRVAPCQCTDPNPITVWQVWNEQNSAKYFAPKPRPSAYADLLVETATAIRSEQPQAEIALGGMWGPKKTDVMVPVARYLKKLLRDGEARAALDSVALHPYGPGVRTVEEQVENARKVLDKRGARATGIWVTELGWASGGPKREPLVKSRRKQAKLLKSAYKLLIRKRGAWNIRGVHWYSWRDTSGGVCKWCPKSGLRTKSGAPKPAARAFRKLPRSG